ncbi:MAG TPA: L-histidine N(alpha)-methyltransferase [Terriglobales bacterium]|nr:L-histidine N(alpha)-methyltransferase [Terriglobales bacterium]
MLTPVFAARPELEFAADVRQGLAKPQKELLSKYLYDDVGSALFEVISVLPEYGLTRADERVLQRNAYDIVEHLPLPLTVAELGSGSGKKTRWLLKALARRQHTSYHPIEISPTALAMCKRELGDIDSLSIVGFEREYLDGLAEVTARRKKGQHVLVLFLGSTIGNFDRPAGVQFLRDIRQTLLPGDTLLLGTDLLKPEPQLLDAYDDSLGVTAAFNKNLLVRINRELGGNFSLADFQHLARYNPQARSIEMHLLSKRLQTVTIPVAGVSVDFAEGETIWTESSHKYTREEVCEMARDTGFHCTAHWLDQDWPFAESLLIAE